MDERIFAFLPPSWHLRRQREERAHYDRLVKEGRVVPWDFWTFRFQHREDVVIDGPSYDRWLPRLFDTPAVSLAHLRQRKGPGVVQPHKGSLYLYANIIMPAGRWLPLFQGGKRGRYAVTEDVLVPTL